MRILYSSNAFWAASGYGTQGKSLLPRLANLEVVGGRENVAMFAWFGLQGGVHNVEGFTVYPGGNDPYGNDIIGAHAKHFKADVVITLIDAWVLDDIKTKIAPAKYCPWMPVDHDPVPNKVLKGIEGADKVLSYSKWGQEKLLEKGVESLYIPHGIEPETFYFEEDRQAIENFKRNVLGAEDFLAVMVSANKGYPDRKGFQQQLKAFSKFIQHRPKAKLYIHTEPTTQYGGLDLVALCENFGISENVIFPDRYQNYIGIPADYLRMIYNAGDVLLCNSMAEGFGIPIIEAQACGTPVIVTDFSSMPELVEEGEALQPLDTFWTPMNSWQALPNHTEIHKALVRRLNNPLPLERKVSLSIKTQERYNWDTLVQENWKPFLESLA